MRLKKIKRGVHAALERCRRLLLLCSVTEFLCYMALTEALIFYIFVWKYGWIEHNFGKWKFNDSITSIGGVGRGKQDCVLLQFRKVLMKWTKKVALNWTDQRIDPGEIFGYSDDFNGWSFKD